MSLSAWNWVDNRNDFLDFVPVNKDSEILCLIPKPPEVDPGLFIRPFRDEVWKGIGVLLTIGFLMFFLPFIWWEDWDDWMSNNLIEFSIWFFFVLINAYYGGALTMFFVSEVTIPFNTITDVLTIFPTWNLVFIDGNQNYFKTPASQVIDIYLFIDLTTLQSLIEVHVRLFILMENLSLYGVTEDCIFIKISQKLKILPVFDNFWLFY